MKKALAPAWLGAWLTGLLPNSIFKLGKKTPWYRQSLIGNIPVIAVALVVPFALFLLWKAMQAFRPHEEETV